MGTQVPRDPSAGIDIRGSMNKYNILRAQTGFGEGRHTKGSKSFPSDLDDEHIDHRPSRLETRPWPHYPPITYAPRHSLLGETNANFFFDVFFPKNNG